MRKKRILLTALLPLAALVCHAQGDTLSLGDCIRMGLENNIGLRTSAGEVRKSRLEVTANRARLLPVLQAFGSFTDNVTQSPTVGKASAWGTEPSDDASWMQNTPMRYNTRAGLQLSLPLYDQSLYTGIAIARRMEEISRLGHEKAREELAVEIGRAYYLAQACLSRIRLAEENIDRLVRLQGIAQALLDNGMSLKVDVQRVTYRIEAARTDKEGMETRYAHQLNLLRYLLDLPPERALAVRCQEDISPTDGMPAAEIPYSLSDGLPDLRLAERRVVLAETEGKAIRQRYLPTLSLTGGLAYTKYAPRFSHYFHGDAPRGWYDNFYWGLSLNIPLFDGGQKRTALRKNRIDRQNRQDEREDLRKRLEKDLADEARTLDNNRHTLRKQSDNCRLALHIYEVTMDKYKEGLSSMTDLLQDEINISEAQAGRIDAYCQCKLSELNLLRLSGRMDELVR